MGSGCGIRSYIGDGQWNRHGTAIGYRSVFTRGCTGNVRRTLAGKRDVVIAEVIQGRNLDIESRRLTGIQRSRITRQCRTEIGDAKSRVDARGN